MAANAIAIIFFIIFIFCLCVDDFIRCVLYKFFFRLQYLQKPIHQVGRIENRSQQRQTAPRVIVTRDLEQRTANFRVAPKTLRPFDQPQIALVLDRYQISESDVLRSRVYLEGADNRTEKRAFVVPAFPSVTDAVLMERPGATKTSAADE